MVFLTFVTPMLLFPSPARGWDFSIESAAFYFRYVYSSQLGSNGFFGPFNVDAGTSGADYAPLNGWYDDKLLSGTTAETSTTRFAIFPILKLNNAIAIRGTYRINSDQINNLAAVENPDFEYVISYGRWTRLWVTAQTPLGAVYFGRRGFRQACGFQFSSAESAEDIFDTGRRSVEMFLLDVPWGPFHIGAGFYPWRLGSRDYWNLDDQNAARHTHLLGYLKYSGAVFETGFGGFYSSTHDGPESQQTTTNRNAYPPRQTRLTEGWIYLKYNDGRFFMNAEADWFYRSIAYKPAMNGFLPGPNQYDMNPSIPSPVSQTLPSTLTYLPPYTESWRYMAELGLYSGPAKISLLLAHLPGPDRRHGVLYNTQPYVQEAERSAYAVFNQYNILMGKFFRAGVNSFLDMSASNNIAVRFDYLLASNLNLILSFQKAQRSSHGYGWGYVKPDTSKGDLGAARFGYLKFKNPGSFESPVPAIPDNDLGWELHAGIIWKLLENWHVLVRGAYWQPGKWFNYACIDKSTPNWDAPDRSNNYGINPNRFIDPVFGLEIFVDTRL